MKPFISSLPSLHSIQNYSFLSLLSFSYCKETLCHGRYCPYKPNIIYSQNMLRKNNLERARQEGRCTVSCQTQQFLLYLALEDKLENVYKEYRALQKKYEESQRLVQFLQHKTKYLETSLFEISVTYNNKMANSNIRRIEEIKSLEQRIHKETKELESIHQSDGPLTHKTLVSVMQEEKGKESKVKGNKASSAVKEKNTQEQSCIKYKRIPPQEQREDFQFSLNASNNQFLPQETAVLGEKKERINCESDRYEDNHKLPLCDQSATYRRPQQSKCNKSSSKKKTQSNKENINYEKLVKIEAELKMKQFMQKFQMDSQNYEQFPQQAIPNDQLTLLNMFDHDQSPKISKMR